MSMVWKNLDILPRENGKVVKLVGKVTCFVFMDISV